MLTNSAVGKLKASKSSRDLEESSQEYEAEGRRKILNFEKGGEGDRDYSEEYYSRSRTTSSKTHLARERIDKPKSRPRLRDEFQMPQGERRGTHVRGRGGGFSRKVERENDGSSTSRGKFQESLKGSSSDLTLTSSKYYNDSDGSKFRLDNAYNVPDDPRISKVLRRLSREEDPDKFLTLCDQLQDSLSAPDNTRYVRRAFDEIATTIMGIFHRGPAGSAQPKIQVAKCLGLAGYVLIDQDFKRYMEWIFSQFEVERNDYRLLLLKAMLETVRLDKEAPNLKDAVALMAHLQATLETAVEPELIMATVDVIVSAAESYPDSFTKHFRDTVDILVGWHIEGSQSPRTLYFASRCLQRLDRYWASDITFTVTLLTQFLEDMDAYDEDLSGRSSPDDPVTPENTVGKVSALIKVFNTVAKSLGQHLSPAMSPLVSWSFLADSLANMLRAVSKMLVAVSDQDLVVAANECAHILLSHLQSRTAPAAHRLLYAYIQLQLDNSDDFSEATVVSTLRLVVKTVREIGGNLPAELVHTLLRPASRLHELRFSSCLAVQEETLAVYHALLNLKNVPLLQEVYRHVLGDLENAYCVVVPATRRFCAANPYPDDDYLPATAEAVVLFYLRALTDLANATNSIIGMWALNPTILDLLARDLRPYDPCLSPLLQYSLLYLLHSHCSRSNNFVSSCAYVSAHQDRAKVCDMFGLPANLGPDAKSVSPTSGHFVAIVDLLARLLSAETTCEEIRVLLLTWSREVFLHSEPFFKLLYPAPEMERLVSLAVRAGCCTSPAIVSRVGENIEQLLSIKNVDWRPEHLTAVVDFCLFHLNSSNEPIRKQTCRLLRSVRWDVTVTTVDRVLESADARERAVDEDASTELTFRALNAAARGHVSGDPCPGTPMQSQHFRRLMGYLLQGLESTEGWLRDVFCTCWPASHGRSDKKNTTYASLALASTTVLLQWATWEAAQWCVVMKLRTPLGKPQDTFTSIESAIKQLAREIGGGAGGGSGGTERRADKRSSKVSAPCRVRRLLEFLDALEKAMYNAAEGCATAMPPAPKPVRTFFHTNKSTCGEWLTRIRTAVVAVSIRAGQAAAAVRHGHCLLAGLVEAGNTQGADFETAVMHVSWALCKLGEPAAISGLYPWCREVSGRKFPWLKAAAHQAGDKLELAAEDYRRLLEHSSPRTSPLHSTPAPDENATPSAPRSTPADQSDPQVVGFMADQLADCYDRLQNWSELHRWKAKEAELWTNRNGGTPLRYVLNETTADQAKAMQEFDERDFAAASELMQWPMESELPDSSRCWNSYKLMAQAGATLTNVAVQLAAGKTDTGENLKFHAMLEACSNVSRDHLQDGVQNAPSEFLHQALLLEYAALGLGRIVDNSAVDCQTLGLAEGSRVSGMDASLLARALWWAQYFDRVAAPGGQVASGSGRLQLEVVRTARREGNLNLARRLLVKYLEDSENVSAVSGGKRRLSLDEMAVTVMKVNASTCDIASGWTVDKMRSYSELAKLLYASDAHDRATEVCAFAAMSSRGAGDAVPALAERGARLLVTLAKWLQERRQGAGEADAADSWMLIKLVEQERAKGDVVLFGPDDGPVAVPSAEVNIGHILQVATARCPTLAKTWSQYATWCYRWGKRTVETPLSSAAGGQLTDVDRAAVLQLVPRGTTVEELETVTSILSRTRSYSHGDEDIDGDDINTSDMIKSRLLAVRALDGLDARRLDALVGVWRDAQRRVYSFYQQAAAAYFKYLSFCDDKGTNDCNTIIATLRLLRMTVKHATELQDVLEAGLAATPTRPWKVIIPQLFSRLSHPETYVRARVSELLCRVAEDAPHLITFPAVVGAADGGARLREISSVSGSRLFRSGLSQPENENEEDEEEEEDDDEEEDGGNVDGNTSVLKNCFMAMVDTLSKQAPLAIAQVQLVVTELHRITLLWDELWLGTLVQHHAEIARRLAQLEAEVRRVDDNASLGAAEKEALVAEKHRIIMKPLVFVLEQLHAITSVPPETPHEVWFQEKYNSYISDALARLRHPPDPRKPHDAWHPLKTLQSRLQHRAQKRSAYAIRMSDVSPALAALRHTAIAMPGVAPRRRGEIITVAAVGASIAVLPTKTKPKKLVFHGSDGRIYTYLFKGLEDLHLDERIMQFLSIANTMLAAEHRGDGAALHQARHYSVIPLGPRSGLISWVDGVTPMFGLYKRWQQRELAAGSLKGNVAGTNPLSGGGQQVMRPSEMFYSKLTPLLKEKGVTNLDNRKEWPLPILRQVLTELMEETPKDLLAKELWCHSVNAGGWWRTTRTYSYSVAVMSIIGYIIGLGDRHLDNVLVDLDTGEVVHIDYNVCFEKGKTLRVPEKVPFRMTQNIRTALGVTGVEGIFRLTCEHVLRVMKKGRETLLTLLEAFVYDPLIDWTPGNETGYTGAVYGGGRAIATETKQSRKELEHEVTRAMFCVRITEIRAEWLDNQDQLLSAIPQLEMQLLKWLDARENIRVAEESLQDYHQQMALVKEAEAQSASLHPLYTLPGRYAKHRRAADAVLAARAALAERADECEKLLVQHAAAFAAVRGPQLAAWIAEASRPQSKDEHMVFDLVKEFLQNAGQGSMVAQCEQSEAETGQLAQQQAMLTRSCLDLLTQYKSVAGLYPASYINTHRATAYRRWATHLLANMTLESCHEVRAQFAALFSPDHPAVLHTHQQILACSYQQQAILNEANLQLQKRFDRMAMEGTADGTARVDAAYLEARAAIMAFPRADKGRDVALECVNVTALCALNKRYIMMETAAFCAGDSLVDLTSREGDWFLDEMYVVSTSITELATLVPTHHSSSLSPSHDTRVQLVLHCIHSAHGIYKGLQELNYNFHTIILPEAVERIQAEEPTVLAMIAELNEMVATVGTPLAELLAQLEKHLRCIIMEMDSPHTTAQDSVAVLREAYREMTGSSGVEDRPGMMLLMGFDGLFEKLQKDGDALVAALDTLDTPHCWRKIDQVRDAKAISAPVFNDATRGVLEDIFLLKRLQTMQEFFALCCQMALNTSVMHDDDRLMKPIRRYTADYVSRRLLGVTSQTLAIALCLLLQRIGLDVTVEVDQRDVGAESKVSLEELCRKAVEVCMKHGLFSQAVLQQASGLTSSLESTWRRKENARRLVQEAEARRATLKRLHYQLTAYHWLHEDGLAAQGVAANAMVLINRSSFMMELRQTFTVLLTLQPRLADAQTAQHQLVSSVEQRLRWAAGANPALMEVLAAFEAALAARDERLAAEQRLALEVGHSCNVLLHHEALRTRTSEGVANDNAFLQLLDQCEQACMLSLGYDQTVTPVEENLIQLLPPEGNVDRTWIQNLERLISGSVKVLQHQIVALHELLRVAQDNIKNEVLNVRRLMSEHHKLMADVKNLVKPMLKYEDADLIGLPEYWSRYRAYLEEMASLIRELTADDLELDSGTIRRVLEQLRRLGSSATTGAIYQELLAFGRVAPEETTAGRLKRPPLLRQESVCLSPRRGVPGVGAAKAGTRDPHTGKAVQERNAYAVGVWRRVRTKFEGRDPDLGRKVSNQEQVDYVIREATNLDNLALLYEGWTPWV